MLERGANAVCFYLQILVLLFGLGETDVLLGQNKNNVMMQYLAWRVCTGLHKTIILSFLPHGHTKSLQTGWGRKYKTLEIETMDELRQDIESSTPSNHINQAFHTGPEKGLQHTSDKIFCLD